MGGLTEHAVDDELGGVEAIADRRADLYDLAAFRRDGHRDPVLENVHPKVYKGVAVASPLLEFLGKASLTLGPAVGVAADTLWERSPYGLGR